MQTYIGKGSEKYLLASKQDLYVSYLLLPPPTITINKKSNAVQGIIHGMATLHRNQGCIYSWIGGIVMGEGKACIPTVFRLARSDYLKELFRKGKNKNSYLEMAGLLMLWLVMEEFFPRLRAAYVVLFSDNSPTIGWVKRLAVRGQLVAMQLVQELTLRLKKSGASPLMPFHIAGKENSMTDIPSRLFGSNIYWFCKNDTDLLNLFKTKSPFAKPGLLDRLHVFQCSDYEGYFSDADAAFRNG